MRTLVAVCTAVLWASAAVAQPASLQGPGWDALRAGDHSAHHRGQMTVYLRLLGSKVPSVYGPTADDASFG